MRPVELLIPASSLEVLKIAVIMERMPYISAEKYLDFVRRQKTFPWRIWQRASSLPMSMA